jgi:hypothetical protein
MLQLLLGCNFHNLLDIQSSILLLRAVVVVGLEFQLHQMVGAEVLVVY